MDPATMAMFAKSIIGEKQLGGVAPAFQPGQPAAPLGAKEATDSLIRQQMARINQAPVSPAQIAQLAGIPQMARQIGPPTSTPPIVPPDPQMGPPSPQDDPLQRFRSQGPMGRIGGFLGGFAGNVGQTLEDPRKLLGIAGLSEIDPRLGMAGLLAGGIFGGGRGR